MTELFLTQKTTYAGKGNPNYKGGMISVNCLFCNQVTFIYPSVARKKESLGKKTFCSHKCYYGFCRSKPKKPKTGVLKGNEHPRWIGEKFCVICNTPKTSRMERNAKTCNSSKCRKAIASLSKRGTKNGRYIDTHVYCKQCNIEIKHKYRLNVTFCSRKCMGMWQSENLSGKNSPIYKGKHNASGYPPEWTAKLRREIRKRDNQTCCLCGITKIGLDVHHIDRNKENCAPDNLITVCRKCHRQNEKSPKIFLQRTDL